MKASLCLGACAVLLGATGLTARFVSAQDPEVKVVAAGGAVSMLIGQGGNLAVLPGPDGALVVDSQFDRMVPGIRKAIAGLQADGQVRWLANTHWHGDHVGGNLRLGEGAARMAHVRVRERMLDPGAGKEAAPAGALPVITWEDGLTLHLNGERVEMMHVGPAHTDGDTIVLFHQSGVLHAGDLFFNGMFPFVDLDSGGSVLGLLGALNQIQENIPPSWKIIPGHGPLAGSKELAASIRMIDSTLQIVSQRVADGMKSAEIVAAGLPEEWASWSWDFVNTERWLTTLARECGAK